MGKKNGKESTVWNVYGGQVNMANDHATVTAVQNNSPAADELNHTLAEISQNIESLDAQQRELITDVIEMLQAEFAKPVPKPGVLRNCVTLIAPMITMANGAPVLADNLQKLADYITNFIR